MAMNIISKEKKEIRWIGLPTNTAQECQGLEVWACLLDAACQAVMHHISRDKCLVYTQDADHMWSPGL